MKHVDYNIAEHLPLSIDKKNLHEVAETVDRCLRELDALTELVGIYPRIDSLSSAFIDALAIQFHVDFYNRAYPLAVRRALVKNSIRWHAIKGTRAAVEQVITTIWGDAEVSEWFEYGGEPYFFRVRLLVNDRQIDIQRIDELYRAIEMTKNLRSWIDRLILRLELKTEVKIGVGVSVRRQVDLYPAKNRGGIGHMPLYVADVVTTHKTFETFPAIGEGANTQARHFFGAGVNVFKGVILP